MMEFTLAQVEFSLSYERIGIHSCAGYWYLNPFCLSGACYTGQNIIT